MGKATQIPQLRERPLQPVPTTQKCIWLLVLQDRRQSLSKQVKDLEALETSSELFGCRETLA